MAPPDAGPDSSLREDAPRARLRDEGMHARLRMDGMAARLRVEGLSCRPRCWPGPRPLGCLAAPAPSCMVTLGLLPPLPPPPPPRPGLQKGAAGPAEYGLPAGAGAGVGAGGAYGEAEAGRPVRACAG